MKRISLTIGICAFNEEVNIKKLLRSCLLQKGKSFRILEIIVISDGSTDNTVQKVQEIKDKRIICYENKQRIGQNTNQNFILTRAAGEIIVFLEADTNFKTETYIQELIKPFLGKKDMSMTYGTSIPLAKTKGSFFEKMLIFIETLKEKKLKTKSDNLYLCGTGKAISQKIARSFFWPEDVPEDAYAYLYCKQNNLKMGFRSKAILYYRNPANFSDYIRKTTRFHKGKNNLEKYFPKSILNEYRLSITWLLSFLITGLKLKPNYMLTYLVINFVKKFYILLAPGFNPIWEISRSTKILEKYE